jgi:uncharacterized protein YoxC
LQTELAAEFPELAEHSSESFMRLGDLAGELADDPATSFAELDSAAETEVEAEAEQPEAEAEAESEETDVTFVETAAAPAPWHRAGNQPVNRNGGDVQCLDGDCTRAVGIKGSAAIGTHPNQGSPKPPSKLDIALDAVKEEIMVRAKELHLEKDWSKKVAALIDEYQQKLAKVTGNIAHLRAQTKALLRKKKQIQNVQVQNKLRAKLRMAQADLNRLQKQMEHIAGKENEFSDTEKQLKTTMNALKNSLLKLRGQETQKLAAEGI